MADYADELILWRDLADELAEALIQIRSLDHVEGTTAIGYDTLSRWRAARIDGADGADPQTGAST